MKLLDLVLKGQWYDMIVAGIKHEEYREIKPYWTKRLTEQNTPDDNGFIANDYDFKDYTHVRFRRGYTKQSIVFKVEDMSVGRGNSDWGAPTDKDVYIIHLSKKSVKDMMSEAVTNVINTVGKHIADGGELTVDDLVKNVSEAVKIAIGDNELNFIPSEGSLDNFQLMPADNYTKKVLKMLE